MNAATKPMPIDQTSAVLALTLYDLVAAVNDVTDNEEQALAAVVDLFRTGKARLTCDLDDDFFN